MTLTKSKGDLLSGNLIFRILLFTLPIIFSSVLQLLFNAADLVVVGKFDAVNGSVSQAAIGSTVSIINLIVNLFLGLSVGVNVVIANLYGSRSFDKLNAAIQNTFLLAIISGIMVSFIGIAASESILTLMGTDKTVFPLALRYLRIYFIGVPFSMVYNFGSSILRAYGDTKRPLVFLSISGVVNIILNLITVIVFDWGVAGVAVATSVSGLVSCVLIVIHLMRTDSPIKLNLHGIRFDRFILIKILKIGIPASIQSTMFSISNVIVQSAVNSFGQPNIIAGNGNASNIEGFLYAIVGSFSYTAITFTGQCCGAKKYELINKIALISVFLDVAVGLLCSYAAYFLREPLMQVYSSNSADIAAGLDRMNIILPLYFVCGMMDVMSGMSRGMGQSFVPMLITLLGVCGLRILWIFTIFQKYHTPFMLYISYPISWILTFLALTVFFLIVKAVKYPSGKKEKTAIA